MSAPARARAHGRHGGHDEEHEEHENHERWLVSYADMMTLLMVLFIVMFALSEVNQKKFDMFKVGLHAGFGSPQTMLAGGSDLLDSGGSVAPDTPPVPAPSDGGSGGTDANSWKTTSQATARLKASAAQYAGRMRRARRRANAEIPSRRQPWRAGARASEKPDSTMNTTTAKRP